MASTLPTLTTLSCSFIKPSIIHVELNRPKNLNSMNKALFSELKQLFTALNQYEDLRVVVLTGSGKCFTAGLDLVEAPSIFLFDEVKIIRLPSFLILLISESCWTLVHLFSSPSPHIC